MAGARDTGRRAERRWRWVSQRMAKASTPTQRLAVAGDYARAVVAGLPGPAGHRLADELVRVLVDTARNAERGGVR